MKLAEVGQPDAQTSGNNWACASAKRITPALPQHGSRLQVAMFAAQQRLVKKVQLVSCHPDFESEQLVALICGGLFLFE